MKPIIFLLPHNRVLLETLKCYKGLTAVRGPTDIVATYDLAIAKKANQI